MDAIRQTKDDSSFLEARLSARLGADTGLSECRAGRPPFWANRSAATTCSAGHAAATLRNRRWDGKSPLVTGTAQPRDTTSACSDNGYLSLLQSGDECLGAPIYFFFELGTTRLTDTSQGVNLDELARVAKKYGLAVTITGAADSATGTPSINDRLSQSRADYIAKELAKRGVPETDITMTAKGGISDYRPNEANRHTRVALYIK